MKSAALFALTGLFAAVSATPVAPAAPRPLHQVTPHHSRQENGNSSAAPCAQVSQAVYNDPGRGQAGGYPLVPAEIAYNCLKSVPFNASSAKRLLEAMPPYINWQSTLTALKNPPDDYVEKVQDPVDIIGGLDRLAQDIDEGRFESEYDFGWALYTLIQSAHDGHFSYIPDSIGNIFTWSRPIPLVSVSEDGEKLPAVFAFHDVLGMQFKNISYEPSPIVEIDGQDAAVFLEDLSQFGSLQDRDALYNNVFYELAQVSLGTSGSGTGMFTGGGRGRWVYPGPTTTLTFANGSHFTMQNSARVLVSFRNVNSGEELGDQWFYYGQGTAAASAEEDVSTTALAAPGYPQPVVPGPGNLINGFYIDAEGYEDVAVLQVPNFVGEAYAEVPFQRTTQQFLSKSLADGKTKLVIDVQANGGGTILQGYDLFKQLFPSVDPYGANRFRATQAGDLIGQAYSAYAPNSPRAFNPSNQTLASFQASYFDYRTDMTVDGKPFGSWSEKFGPIEVNGDLYTSTSRWNLSDVYIPYSSGGINVTGYGPLANVTGGPRFSPENIVLLTDGYCASTCTIFSEFLTKQTGVKTIALGGRANKNPIQAIGGVKGSNNYQWGFIQNMAQMAIMKAEGDLKQKLNSSVLRADYYNDLVYNRASGSPGVNVRDALLYNDTSGIATQFIYEEADCRLFYTPEMTVDATAIWKAAADAQWGDNSKCVSGYAMKRDAHEVTTNLKRRQAHTSQAVALQQFEAFEKTFDLKTQCKLHGDGFMHP